MRVVHVTASLSAKGGGIPVALQSLTLAQSRSGISPQVIGHDDHGAALSPWPEGCPIALPVRRVPGMRWARTMGDEILAAKPEVIHTHGLWTQGSMVGPHASRRANIPYLVSPHGMLDPWALCNSPWKKRLAGMVFENSHLRGAACIHALCESEAQAIRSYGLRNPVCVIPNGVDLPAEELSVIGSPLSVIASESASKACKPNRQQTTDNGQRILLFLGRLHPKKGLVNALRAWDTCLRSTIRDPRSSDWTFVIAGWDQGDHEAALKRLCSELGLAFAETSAGDYLTDDQEPITHNSPVVFVGPAFGEQKDQLLRRASAFILPSFSEGLPMSVLEAWAYRLPVLMTDHCNLPEGFAADAALRIDTDAASLAEGMRLLLHSPICDLRSLGANGRALVERQFTWPQIAAQLHDVYEWVLGGGQRPGSVCCAPPGTGVMERGL